MSLIGWDSFSVYITDQVSLHIKCDTVNKVKQYQSVASFFQPKYLNEKRKCVSNVHTLNGSSPDKNIYRHMTKISSHISRILQKDLKVDILPQDWVSC